jgi:hypothetical protein
MTAQSVHIRDVLATLPCPIPDDLVPKETDIVTPEQAIGILKAAKTSI